MNPKTNFFQSVRSAHPGLVAALGLGVLVLGTFGRSWGYAFLKYDSTRYILEDRALRKLDWEHISAIFTSYYFINYNPLHRLSYAIDWALWGGAEPGPFRSTNFLLHWLAAFFVFLFIRELTRKDFAAWFCALVFALHPTRVESVVWLAQRKDVLAAAFGFAALWAYLKVQGSGFRVQGSEESQSSVLSPQSSPIWYVTSLVLFAAALASKAQWVPLCGILPLLDLYRRQKLNRNRLLAYLPFVLLSLLFAWLAIDSQLIVGQKGAAAQLSLWERVAHPFLGIGVYVTHTLWPVNLCPRYPETVAPDLRLVVFGMVATTLGLVVTWKSWRGKRHAFFGFGWFMAFLSPMLNLLPGNLVPADRYLYVSIVGLVFPAALWLAGYPNRVKIPVLCLLTLGMAGLTLRYEPAWKNDYTLWAYSVKQIPDDAFALTCLGKEQMDRRDFGAARTTFQKAAALPIWFGPLVTSASKLERLTGGDPKGILLESLAQFPNSPDLMAAMGSYYKEEKNYGEAEKWFLESTKRRRTNEVLRELALVYEETNQPEKGIQAVKLLLGEFPFQEEYWLFLGRLYEQKKAFDLAETAYRQSARLDAQLLEPRFRLARLAFQRADLTATQTWLDEIIQFPSGHTIPAPVLNLQAATARRQGRRFEALVFLTQAVRLEDTPQYRLNCIRLKVELGQNPRSEMAALLSKWPELRADLEKDEQLKPLL